jgi:hypothetical protein
VNEPHAGALVSGKISRLFSRSEALPVGLLGAYLLAQNEKPIQNGQTLQ